MKIYLEIYNKSSKLVVKRLDVTDNSDRTIEKIEMSMNINLNHESFATKRNDSEIELEII